MSFHEFREYCVHTQSYLHAAEALLSTSSGSRSGILLSTASHVVRWVETCESWEDLTSRATPILLQSILALPLAEVEMFLRVLTILRDSFSRLRIQESRKEENKTIVEIDVTDFVSRIATIAVATAWDRSGIPPAHVVFTGVQSLADGNSFEDAIRHAMEAASQGFSHEVPLTEAAMDLGANVAMAPLREEVLRGCQRSGLKIPRGMIYVMGALYFSTNVTRSGDDAPPTPNAPTFTRRIPQKRYTWPFSEEEEGSTTIQLEVAAKNIQGAVSQMWGVLF